MDLWATKTHQERQEEEDERLVRPSPSDKPPRRDLRRERTQPDTDPDKDDASDKKDRSKNYKNIGGSMRDRIVQAAKERIPAKSKETGETVLISPNTLKEKPGEYEPIEREEEAISGGEPTAPEEPKKPKGKKPKKTDEAPVPPELEEMLQGAAADVRSQAEANPKLQHAFESLVKPGSELDLMAQGDVPIDRVFPSLKVPEGVTTLKQLQQALRIKPKAKPKAPKEPKPKKEPEGGESGGEEKPEKAQEPAPAPEPTEAQKHGIGDPKRRPVNAAEKEEALSLLVDTFSPDVAADLIAANYHPDDVKTLVRDYNSAKMGVKVKDVGDLAAKVSNFYQPNPSKVSPPTTGTNASGEKVSFDQLTPDEQAESTRQHQLRVAALSIAAKDLITSKLMDSKALTGTPRIPRPLATHLASMMLTNAPDEQAAHEATATFDETLKSGVNAKINDAAARQLLERVSHNPTAHAAATAYLQANDYGIAKEKFLKGDDDTISEWQEPEDIIKGLKKAGEFFDSRNDVYGDASEHPAATFFRLRVIGRLRTLDPTKARKVLAELPHLEEEEYKHHHAKWEKANKEWEAKKAEHDKALEAYQASPEGKEPPGKFAELQPHEPVRPVSAPSKSEGTEMWQAAFAPQAPQEAPVPQEKVTFDKDDLATAQEAVDKTDALWDEEKPGEEPPPEAKEPEPKPKEPEAKEPAKEGEKVTFDKDDLATAEEAADETDALWDEEPVDAPKAKKPPKPSKKEAAWSGDFTYPASPVMGSADKTGVYHGVDPYAYGPPAYPGWLQPHQRDLGEADHEIILGSASEWLASPLLSVAVDGLVPDARLRAALDLAIYAGPYNGQIQPNVYNHLLAKLAGKPEPGQGETLLTVREKTAGYEVARLDLLISGPSGFNADARGALHKASFAYQDASGAKQADGTAAVLNIKACVPCTDPGFVQEAVVSVDLPKGSEDAAVMAIQASLRPLNLKVAKAPADHKPELRKMSKDDTSTFTPTPSDHTGGSNTMKASQEVRKFAAQLAADGSSKVAFEMLALADRLAEEEKKIPPFIQEKIDEKKDDKKEASGKYATLRSLVIKQASAVPAEQRGPLLPILQALKDLG